MKSGLCLSFAALGGALVLRHKRGSCSGDGGSPRTGYLPPAQEGEHLVTSRQFGNLMKILGALVDLNPTDTTLLDLDAGQEEKLDNLTVLGKELVFEVSKLMVDRVQLTMLHGALPTNKQSKAEETEDTAWTAMWERQLRDLEAAEPQSLNTLLLRLKTSIPSINSKLSKLWLDTQFLIQNNKKIAEMVAHYRS